MKTEENEQPAMTYCELCQENYDEEVLDQIEICNFCGGHDHCCQFTDMIINRNIGSNYHYKCLDKSMTLGDFLIWNHNVRLY